MNSFTVTGWVKFLERKSTSTGKAYMKFQINIPNPTREGDDKKTYTFLRCTYWGDAGIEDGDEVLAHGHFVSRTYQAKDGSKRPDFGMGVETIAKIERGKTADFRHADPGPAAPSDDIPF